MESFVRRAEEKDLESLVSLTAAEAREAEGIEPDSPTVRRGVEVGLRDPDVAMYWVVESDRGEIVASASVVREWSDWRAKYYWWIQSMYVLPGQRGQGLPERLVQAVMAEARDRGATHLRLYVHEQNERAKQAYHRLGFRDAPYGIMSRDVGDGEQACGLSVPFGPTRRRIQCARQ